MLLLATPVVFAAEAVQDAPETQEAAAFDPTLVSWSAGKGMTIPDPEHGEYVAAPPWLLPAALDAQVSQWLTDPLPPSAPIAEQAPGRFEGGVTMHYEQVRIAAQQLWFWQTPIAEGQRAWPQRVLLLPGEQGPEADRVHLDSRLSELPSINVRGLLRPTRVTIHRQALAPSQSADADVTFHLLLEDVGPFRLRLLAAEGAWHTVTGEGDYLVVELVSKQLQGTLSEPRIAGLHVLARVDSNGQVAWDDRIHLSYWHPQRPGRVDSRRISVLFDDQGQIRELQSGADTTVRGLDPSSSIPDLPAYHAGKTAQP